MPVWYSVLFNFVVSLTCAQFTLGFIDLMNFATVYLVVSAFGSASFYAKKFPMTCVAPLDLKDHEVVLFAKNFCATHSPDLYFTDLKNPANVTAEMAPVTYYFETSFMMLGLGCGVCAIFYCWKIFINYYLKIDLNKIFENVKEGAVSGEERGDVILLFDWIRNNPEKALGASFIKGYIIFKTSLIFLFAVSIFVICRVLLEADYFWALKVLLNMTGLVSLNTVRFTLDVLCQPHMHAKGILLQAIYLSCNLPLNFIYKFGYLFFWGWIHALLILNCIQLYRFKQTFSGDGYKLVIEDTLYPIRSRAPNGKKKRTQKCVEDEQPKKHLSPNLAMVLLLVKAQCDRTKASDLGLAFDDYMTKVEESEEGVYFEPTYPLGSLVDVVTVL